MAKCCQFWFDRGYKTCMACASSTKAWNEYGRKLKRIDELQDDTRVNDLIASYPPCTKCGKPLTQGQFGVHATCSDNRTAFHFDGKSKKDKRG
jgi:hypothetical protein